MKCGSRNGYGADKVLFGKERINSDRVIGLFRRTLKHNIDVLQTEVVMAYLVLAYWS